MRIISDTIQLIHPRLQDAVAQKKEGPIIDAINHVIASGCDAIDLNIGPLYKEGSHLIPYLLDVVRNLTRLPLFIDSPNAAAAHQALATGHSEIHINGFSLQAKRFDAFVPLMAQYQEALFVGYLLSPEGSVPTDPDGRLQVAADLFTALEAKGSDLLDRLIVDPVVVPLMWDEGPFHALEVIRTVRTLPELAGRPIKTMGGLSNLTSGKVPLKKRTLMEASYIPLLAEAGLDYILMNTTRKASMDAVHAANLLTEGLPFSWAALKATP